MPGTLGDMDGMTWMAGAMRAAQAQLETATHNLANAGTDGFRRVQSTVALTPAGLVARETPGNAQGGIRETGRPFDLALLGPGTFDVGGKPTRNGAFIRDREGYLADLAGRRVAGIHGPIHLAEDAPIGRAISQLRLPAGTTVRSGALEASGVDSIGETLSILTAQRAFETAQKTLVAIDQTREKAVNDVVRLK
jgi:flagellar basal body rod protein FlgG